ncbi:MAG TPA: GNAT family N-acetyltransferase [Bacillota bacterium]|nr:GNAT family N-acetyltransferase [Bacillota bacterium]
MDKEDYPLFLKRVEENPDFYLVAIANNELVGLCYGAPSDKTESALHLQGIAVSLDESKDLARRGIGSSLLSTLEKAAKSKGFISVGLGAADDVGVEAFYLKNAYRPYELVAKSNSGLEYARISIDDYESGKAHKPRLKDKYNTSEVIFIFKKDLE